MVKAIYGQGDSGKSTSIRFIARVLAGDARYNLLWAAVQGSDEELNREQLKEGVEDDFLAIFQDTIQEKIVLLASGGDDIDTIQAAINVLGKQAENFINDWSNIKKSGNYLHVLGVKYSKSTEHANERAEIVYKLKKTNNTLQWIQPPYVEDDDTVNPNRAIDYNYIFIAFAYSILATYDSYYQGVLKI